MMQQYPTLPLNNTIFITLLQGRYKKLCNGKELRLEYYDPEKPDTSSRNQPQRDSKSDMFGKITRFRKSMVQKKHKDS